MHIVRNISPAKTRKDKKIYQSVLLRESYRENGKVKKRTIANLSHCSKEEISALELALKHKDKLSVLKSLGTVDLEEGLSVGAALAVYEVGKRLGIDKALGGGIDGKLAFWQVIARVIDQGSRLSAVRLAQFHAACDVIGICQGFDENRLYENLRWVARNQEVIEDKLFKIRRGEQKPELFLYDVTSSYLEGELNYFGEYGYTRDGKKGKKQIVVGLLCDENGEPVSTEVFRGNTSDSKTFLAQVKKAVERFGCSRVTFVGDRGMIRGIQIDKLPQLCHYITAITKTQIESMLKTGTFQMELFEDAVCEITAQGVRYVLRRNPQRRQELEQSRRSKQNKVLKAIEDKNIYLQEHPKAKTKTAVKAILGMIKKLKIDKWFNVAVCGRTLQAKINQEALEEASKLDGCYVLKTDLPKEAASALTVHDRYKDLALVERAFRTCKTAHLELRPINVRTEESTIGHVVIVMLAYLIRRRLEHAWSSLDMTVEEGIKQLSTLSSMRMSMKEGGECIRIPRPRLASRKLLDALGISLPFALPHYQVNVVTRKKLTGRRKTR